jgi:hypothetical protein
LLSLVAVVALPLVASSAYGEGADANAPEVASPKRPVPSYDGREPPPTPASEVLLGVPRFLLAPPYLINEYLLRRPLAVVVPAAEKAELTRKAYDFFLFAPDHKGGIVPIVDLELEFYPSAGIYAFWNDAGFKGNDLSLQAQGWADDVFGGTVMQRIKLGEDRTLQFRLSETHRPDRLFYGIGPSSLGGNESRYGEQKLDGSVAHEWRFWRSSRIETMIGVRDVLVYDGHFTSHPSLTEAVALGRYPLPFGYEREYTAEYNRIIAAIDTRVPEARRGSGVRLELDGEQGSDVRNTPESGWIRYGATAAGYVDLNGLRRVLSLSVTAQFVDPLSSSPLPFTELVYLGGTHAMEGFYQGRLLGRSAGVATAGYTWPIGPWVDGDLQFAVGNVFGEHLEGFDARLLRYSAALGVSIGRLQKTAVMGSQDAPIEVLIGLGSETFQQGGEIDTVRLVAGVPMSF